MLMKSLALALAGISLSTQAAIVDLGNITRDTASGLDWLDLTATAGLSYTDVLLQMDVGGDYEGWRYASAAEFDQLVVSFGYARINTECTYAVQHCDETLSGENNLIEDMINTLGDTQNFAYDQQENAEDISSTGSGFSLGLLSDNFFYPQLSNARTLALIHDGETIDRASSLPFADLDDAVVTAYTFALTASSDDRFGSFLVRPSEVPIPAAAWLFSSALIGLAGVKRIR
ncbi:VPLPA-CTERM sorting domain-containing protein [Oceanicoccus sp. KOV_DT_Chl]|uniref:VPLPA-CTERM sorting domain-containing protein n=1 Tax=Oceanicoccus sp. KOV_DT_Chl TaxID=1904639 RepID=UPI000C7C12E2|nr:VPLPA-CTERM sorting domain-containing protein [Oceanicoccus sp. KOV_DT_Chl]